DRDSYIEDLKNAATWADSEPVKKAILYFLQEPETQILSFLPDVIQNHPRCINMSFSLMNKIGLESLSITAQLLKHPDTEEYIQYRCCRLAAEIGSEFPPTSDITEWFSEHILPLAHSKHWFVQLAALYALNVIKHDALDDIIRDILLNSEELDELVVCAAISLCGEIEQIHHTICECPKKNMVESAFSALDLGSLTSTQRQALVHVASEQDAILFLARAYYHSSDPKHLIDLAKLESSVGHKPYKQYIRTLFERWYKKEELLQNPNVLIQLVVKLLEPKDLNRTLLIAISQMLYQVKRTGGDKNEIELLESQIRERLISDVIEELPHSQVEYPEMGSRTWFDDSGGYFYHSTAQDGRRLIVQRVDITNRDKLLSIKKSGLLEKLDDGFCSFAVEPSQRENWIEIVYEIPDGYQLLDSYLRGTEPTPSNYLSERTIVRWLKQMCSIVKAFHAHGLVLGGINLGHLVIDKTTENLKVFNFVLNPVQHPFQSARVHWGSKAQDIYSLGVVLYALATLEIPQNYWENPHDEPDWLAPKYEKNLAYHIYPSGFYQLTSKTTGYDCTKLSIEKVLKMVERLEEDIHSIEKSAEGLDFADTIPKREVEFLKLLIDFKENFNQNQGYMKFWDGGKGNRLKSNPHQIADGFMRKYFEKLSRDIQGFKFKEGEKAGVGECDFLVEWDNLKYIIELEVCGPRYPDNDETAIGQVEEYMKKHNSDVSFIIVFDAIDRESEKRIRSFQKHDRHYHFEYLALNPITPSEAGNAPVYSEK
ncbi:MAG: hypothetical protein H8D67_21880, partial [Deltaproteobacteria bacterium]|nr:hypothetical protein [Deltaproteobacteria bacterium]